MLLPEGRPAGIGLSSVGIVAGPKSAHITGKDKQGLAVLAVRPSRPPSIGAGSLWQAGAWQGWRQDLTQKRLTTIPGNTPWSASAGNRSVAAVITRMG